MMFKDLVNYCLLIKKIRNISEKHNSMILEKDPLSKTMQVFKI